MSELFDFDKKNKKAKFLIGTDEAGRGPLAGPVVAAAVVFKKLTNKVKSELELLNDSKKLTPKKREALYDIIIKHSIYSIKEVDVETIEKINILQSALLAMKLACEEVASQLDGKYEVFVDGNKKIPNFDSKQTPIIKGDATSASVAAASILAKVYRDRLMDKLDEEFPFYSWKKNKGYGTKAHIDAIKEYGITVYHRESFLKKFKNEDNNT